jgi:hypothetical protein
MSEYVSEEIHPKREPPKENRPVLDVGRVWDTVNAIQEKLRQEREAKKNATHANLDN